MSFTSALPANIPKYGVPRPVPRPGVVVCEYTLVYVKWGDIIDPENHRRVYDAAKCVAGELLRWHKELGL